MPQWNKFQTHSLAKNNKEGLLEYGDSTSVFCTREMSVCKINN